jgi:transcriptional regulator with XRE-family HTH domain
VTLRAQWLGKQLRELRESAGLTLKESGEYLQRDGSTVSRFEAGLYPARTPDVAALLDLYGVADEHRREGFIRLSRDVWQSGWWDAYTDDVSLGIVDYAWMEARATGIRSFDALIIPGLLQTRAYMEAVIRAEDPDASSDQLSRWVEFRVARQQLLAADQAPSFSTVMEESTLRRLVGSPEIMRGQLSHLLNFSANAEIRIMPFSSGAHASPDGTFRIFELPEPYPAVAYVPSPVGAIYAEGEAADGLKLKFDRIRHDSLGIRESRELIAAIAEDFH